MAATRAVFLECRGNDPEDKSMGATSTTVNARGRSRGTRQRPAAGSLPCFCPALRLTLGVGSDGCYAADSKDPAVKSRVNRKVNAKVNHNSFNRFTLPFTLQRANERISCH